MKLSSRIAFTLAVILTAALFVEFLPRIAQAGNGRKNDLDEYMRQLNGSPRKLGVISGNAATAQDNTNTASTFTIPRGETVFLACDVDAFCIERGPAGAAATSSYTSTTQGFPLSGGKPFPMMMKGGAGNVDLLSCIATANWNCAVFSMD